MLDSIEVVNLSYNPELQNVPDEIRKLKGINRLRSILVNCTIYNYVCRKRKINFRNKMFLG